MRPARPTPSRLLACAVALALAAVLPATAIAHEEHHVAAKPAAAAVEVDAMPDLALTSENTSHVTGRTGFTGGHVTVVGDRLYVGSYGVGMRIYDVSEDAAAPEFLGGYEPGNRADAVPDAAVYGDRHLAVLNGTGRTKYTHDTRTDRSEFLDVTDPSDPKLLHEFVGPDDGEAHNGDLVAERRLWLPSGGSGRMQGGERHGKGRGLRIYDLTPTIDTAHEECRPKDAANACAPELLFAGDPVQLWQDSPYRGQDEEVGHRFTHTHDITVYTDHPVDGLGLRDVALLAEGGRYLNDTGETGSVFVIDITDPGAPVVLNRYIHDSSDGHDPIRYYHEAQFLDGDPSVMLVTDEDLHGGCGRGGGVSAVRVSADLTEATELSDWFIPLGTPAATCSVHVFDSHGYLVFFGSYNAGLQVVDYSNPASPRQVGHYVAANAAAWGAYFHEGYAYVGDVSRGLDVFAYDGPKPDLAVADDDVAVSRKGKGPATVTATVHNNGEVAAGNVVVRITDAHGQAVAPDQLVDRIGAGDKVTISVQWHPRGPGERSVIVTADPDDRIDESREGNNTGSAGLKESSSKGGTGPFAAFTLGVR